jgi:AcrR family transcriptional regulator
MYNKSIQTREKIIKTTIDILKVKDAECVTFKAIADLAGIGVGLINYHFQDKENLIDIAIQTFIHEEINHGEKEIVSLPLSPIEKLKFSMKGYADFLVAYPNISKVSIMNELQGKGKYSLIESGYQHYIPLLEEIFGGEKDNLSLLLEQIVAPIQMMFLQNAKLKKLTGRDFFDDGQREEMIERLIHNLK